jgi:hypothetical protein
MSINRTSARFRTPHVHDQYVTKINWLISRGREDLIDEIADEYERPSQDGTQAQPAHDRVSPELRRAG